MWYRSSFPPYLSGVLVVFKLGWAKEEVTMAAADIVVEKTHLIRVHMSNLCHNNKK